VREDHDRERASHLLLAEIHEMHALGADLHTQNLADDALGFSNVFPGLADGQAVGCSKNRRREQDGQCR